MALATIRGTSPVLYPFTQTISFLTGVGIWQNAGQQRWAMRYPLVHFELPYANLNQSDKNTTKTSFTLAKGRFDNTLSLTIGSATYGSLGFDSDEWSATESVTTQYSAPVKLMQALTQSLSPGTSGQPFPKLANGCMSQLPYTQKRRFQTLATRMKMGPIYTFPEFSSGLTGYPGSSGLQSWTLSESGLTDADVLTRTQHFIDNWARCFSFQFQDEDLVNYPKTHYAMDDLVITRRGKDDASMTIQLEETN
jgi:hypothetical protein